MEHQRTLALRYILELLQLVARLKVLLDDRY